VVEQEPLNNTLWWPHQSMKRWIRLGLQFISLVLFGLILIWGGSEAWQQVAAGDLESILVSLLLLGFATMMSAVRLQLIARSTTGRELAAWPRFYYLNMTARALGLIVPRTLSTLGGKSVGLGALGVSLRRSVWIVILDNAFDLLLLGILVGPALLYLRDLDAAGEMLVLSLALIVLLASGLWWITGAGRARLLMRWLRRVPRLATALHLDPGNVTDLLPPRLVALETLGLTIVLNAAIAICFYQISRAVGMAHPWTVFVAGFPITQLSLILAVTPGGLGLFDASWYGVLLLAGVPHQEALTFVIAQRAYIFVFVLIWAGFSVLLSLASGGGKHA
jgi:uncharacterized membrane protein YbhN (UPF0104 family)